MSEQKPTRGNASRKALNALGGDDEFSVFSVEPEAQKPPVALEEDTRGRPDDTAVSFSVVRFFRKIFGD
ncbi:hypothetical protein ATI61_102139 [Archangium gephyra]|uniref:Uncharacterized protein n=1 Tax=Archangium gephyra TaxID=48 RepID=A0AAC8TGG0_9BACT|nr:hypothetical protein [Archangium gephyra]AKJ05068.1 Hypothetical protein AA314_06694 [Archangium gephyra]REG35771.1 hypothetical protein ATI61_102139 [Archangium gephyra]